MNKPLNFIFILSLAAMISSCAGYHQAIDAYKPVNTSALHIGITRDETQQALQKKPYGIVAARNYADTNTIIEVVQYTEGSVTDNYWLYFVNGKLDH